MSGGIINARGRPSYGYPCSHCGELTNDHVFMDATATCDDCLLERTTPWCIRCGRDHHGGCVDVLVAEALDASAADSAELFLADRARGASDG